VEVEHVLRDFGLILGAGLVAHLRRDVSAGSGDDRAGGRGRSHRSLRARHRRQPLERRGRWTRNELIFLSWSRYTGVIPAAVASILLARGVEGAEIAVSLVALAVCATLLLQATTAGYVARRLDLLE
jgi:hypothetical protein